ncbi:putative N-acetyltransferase YhbS [Tepidamorphus gemmatus]|uniref:Putative N-acetyltransferase YhbS n=1 Tax=Tepidamorphus gemmatus TaxID=747076 RepID=A0A4R3MGG8_9HYPH|nr:N-acetyltransferase [Tepidamorphus gemmatus]TCT11439.1 putative N-acetyltransferase YhbS [Tepidamorphus gemmatus]
MIAILSESPVDAPGIESLLDEAFGPRRRMKTAERLREGRKPADGLALVAVSSAGLIGTVRLWEVDAGGVPALLLGPVAVRCDWQGQGIGGRLVRTALKRAEMAGHKAVILVGDAPYYGRFGFGRDVVAGLALPGPVDPQRFLGLELEPGALSGANGLVRGTGAPQTAVPGAALVDMDRVAVPGYRF